MLARAPVAVVLILLVACIVHTDAQRVTTVKNSTATDFERQKSGVVQHARVGQAVGLLAVEREIGAQVPAAELLCVTAFSTVVFESAVAARRVGDGVRQIEFGVAHCVPRDAAVPAQRVVSLAVEHAQLAVIAYAIAV